MAGHQAAAAAAAEAAGTAGTAGTADAVAAGGGYGAGTPRGWHAATGEGTGLVDRGAAEMPEPLRYIQMIDAGKKLVADCIQPEPPHPKPEPDPKPKPKPEPKRIPYPYPCPGGRALRRLPLRQG